MRTFEDEIVYFTLVKGNEEKDLGNLPGRRNLHERLQEWPYIWGSAPPNNQSTLSLS